MNSEDVQQKPELRDATGTNLVPSQTNDIKIILKLQMKIKKEKKNNSKN